MSKNIIHVEGYDAFKEAANINKEKTVFALFSGSIEENGSSWCPDCVAADPVVYGKTSSLPENSVLIICGVGNRSFWKDQHNVFRKDPSLKLKCVPTLLRLGQPRRLEEEQCANGDLVDLLFTDED